MTVAASLGIGHLTVFTVAPVSLGLGRQCDPVREPGLAADAAGRRRGGCQAGEAGVGTIIAVGSAIWRRCPEKVLGCRAEWAEEPPAQLHALVRTIFKAAQWCKAKPNHAELAQLLVEPRYVGVPAPVLWRGLSNRIQLGSLDASRYIDGFYSLARKAATFPWISHALWFYTQMIRWGQTTFSVPDCCAADESDRPDIYRCALGPLAVNIPANDFFDNRPFAATELLRHAEAGAIPLTFAR
jgi:hypothetical protein